ncbi:MAG TPA: hypothetical protein PLT37_01935 [Kiritimatiellia bacterium]|jgi:D-alanyl-D-alanine carboxypeptidase|nr:hypothetical protein [Kiritimatiellia bacterium]HQF19986.1 hypothetical protein [Kiritimatiellia bacterium]HQG73907.1 hypothetical protein [Kiritimatiellia bacterium]
MNEQMRQMVASKQAERERLARLPFAEKLVLLGRLRERTLAMKGSAARGRIPPKGGTTNGVGARAGR